ncbi:MAG: MFS transporter [Eggerthellaceae bacterium]|nr:MFS transporter [Eggerthellaceae bacterium]
MEEEVLLKRVHYGWVVCLATTLLVFITMGTVSNGFSVFLPYLISEYGFTNTQTSSLVTLRCLMNLCSLLVIGWYYRKLTVRAGTFIAALCAAVAFLLYGTAKTYPLFCAGAVLSGISSGFGSMMPVAILMNRWFVKHRALAVGICGAGSGIATIVLPPVNVALVGALGVKLAFLVNCSGIVLCALVVALLLRDFPADKGLLAVGENETNAETGETGKAARTTASHELTPLAWICLLSVCVFMGTVANPGFIHLPVLYTSEGFDPSFAALLVSGLGIVLTVAKLLYGETSDLLGGRKASLLFGTLLLAGNVLCCFAFTGSTALCVITVILLGIGLPLSTVGLPIWAGDLSRPEDYEKNVRKLQIAYAIGAFAFAGVPGILADLTGSYIPAYMLFSLLVCMAIIALALAYRLSGKR